MDHKLNWLFAQTFTASAVVAFLLVAVQGQISDLPATTGAPDQRQLCASKCDTCPVVCSAPPPPSPPPPTNSNSHQSPPQAPPKSYSSPPSTPGNATPSTPGNAPPADSNTSDGTSSCYHLRHGIAVLLASWVAIICMSPCYWK